MGPATGWLPFHQGLRDDRGRLVGLCPLYVRETVDAEFHWYQPIELAALKSDISLEPRAVSTIPLTPAAGTRLALAEGQPPEHRVLLALRLRQLAIDEGWFSVNVHFGGHEDMKALEQAGFLSRHTWQYHWRNHEYQGVDDFLMALHRKRRNTLRREMGAMEASGIALRMLEPDEVEPPLLRTMSSLYASTNERYLPGEEPLLNEAFFVLLGEHGMPGLRFVEARKEGQLLALALFVEQGDTLYGRYWGRCSSVPFLHFNAAYYKPIQHCIDRGLQRLEPGHGGEFKNRRGFDPALLACAHFFPNPAFHQAVDRWAAGERRWVGDKVREIQGQSQLLRFREAAEEAAEILGHPEAS